jgi:hypothetical protein
VPELKLAQPVRRNLLAPVLIAFTVLGIVIALVLRYTPHRVADLEITHTSAYPSHLVFNGSAMVVGSQQTEDHLYVAINLHITDRLNLPLFIKDLTATLTTSEGEVLTASAVEKQDLPSVYAAFPAVKAMVSSPPLFRETLIDPSGSAEGMVLLHFPITLDTWNHRRSAVLHVDLYHQGPLSITIPYGNGTASTPKDDPDRNSDE